MASGSLVGQSDAIEKQDKIYRKNKSKSKNPKIVPHQYHQQQYSQKTLGNTTAVASKDSFRQSGALNRCEASKGNASPGYSKFDYFVNISFDLSNREEVRALKRKLASELDQVTSLIKRLECTQFQLSKEINRNAATVSVNKNANKIHGVLGEPLKKEKMAPKINQSYENLDVVGSEKSMMLKSNKKLKSNIDGNGFVLNKDLSRLFIRCRNLLERLMKHKYGWVFNKPVDVKGLGLHDYYTIIKHPMDLGTVKARLSEKMYKSPTEFAEDVRITFSNAMLYNPKGQDAHIMAEELSKIFEDMWTKIEAEYIFCRQQKKGHKSHSPKNVTAHLATVRTTTPAPPDPIHTHTPSPAPVRSPAPAAPFLASALPPRPLERGLERVESVTVPEDLQTKTTNLAHQDTTLVPQKPKLRDTDMKDMTYEEKQRLSLNLQELPSDKLDKVVQIIKKRNPLLAQQEDEIEVDIDSFDPETLWELDRFVTNYKKSLSKIKGKVEVAHCITAGYFEDRNLKPLIADAQKEAEPVVEKIVSTSLPVFKEKHGDTSDDSSSSSGSRSDSGSSSNSIS